MTTVAFQGELGAYSEAAVRRFFGEGAVPVPCREFSEVGAVVACGKVDRGLLPVENSLAGSVLASYDVLASDALTIIGEVVTPIHHCVLGVPGATLEGVARFLSHPVALAQCGRFLDSRTGTEAVAVYDTAGAAKQVAETGDPALAAIAGRAAGARYGLDVLATDVEDRPDNQTRFLVVARADGPRVPRTPSGRGSAWKSLLVFETANRPGALLQVLQPFASRGINLTKLESRPAEAPWTYRFFAEIETAVEATETLTAVAEAKEAAIRLRVLGSYPQWSR